MLTASTIGLVDIWIPLCDEHASEADAEGDRRVAADLGLPHRVYDPGPEANLAQNRRACRSELALSLAAGLEWTGKGQQGLHRADVGDAYEVRAVDEARLGLIIRPADKDLPFVLALVAGSDVYLRGWYWAAHARTDLFRREASTKAAGVFWLVPPRALHPMATLPGDDGWIADAWGPA